MPSEFTPLEAIAPTSATTSPSDPGPTRDLAGERAELRVKKFVTSWSGGKDSCLALDRAKRAGLEPAGLFTMFTEGGERSRSHGLTHAVLRAQAEALGLRLFTNNATWNDYETVFVDAWREFRLRGITSGVFGDIDIDENRAWVQRVCEAAGMRALHPLWKVERCELIEEVLDRGFSAMVIAVRDGVLDRSFLGRSVDRELIAEFSRAGIDACGENGEYHTVVTDGPLFQHRLHLAQGESVLHDGVWFLDVTPIRESARVETSRRR
jgi:uncharacterized protein (TIGR00290 family)